MSSNSLYRILKSSRSFIYRTIRTCHTGASKTLISRITPLRNPNVGLNPVLDQWIREDRYLKQEDLRVIIRYLRGGQRYTQALEVSEWMANKGVGSFSSGDHAVKLDLLGRVYGLESAESYFNCLKTEDQDAKTYGALLNCYVREGVVDKSISLVGKMKKMSLQLSSLNYNNLIAAHASTGQLEKLAGVFSDMKENGISPDKFTYRNCIKAYGQKSDLESMEKVLEEMESQPGIIMDWLTYSMVANIYIREGLKEKALIYLRKCEEKVLVGQKVAKEAWGYNHLISLYASIGSKDKILRLWNIQKVMCKKLNNPDYIVMLDSLMKLGEFEEAENLLDEWELSCQTYDFRIPNALLIGYCKKGLVEKAEQVLRGIIGRRKTAIPNSWSIISAGYRYKQNMRKAFECFKEALVLQEDRKGWRPKPSLILSILSWLSDHGDVNEVEDFVKLLEREVELKREMYRALIKTYTRCGKETDGLLERMKADAIEEDEEMVNMLS